MSLLGQALVVMLLVAAFLALRPLAETTPPDQTWLAGLYDDGDHDDVVLSIMDVTAAIEAGPVDLSGPASICLGAVTPVQRQAVPAAPFDVRSGRSPPSLPTRNEASRDAKQATRRSAGGARGWFSRSVGGRTGV